MPSKPLPLSLSLTAVALAIAGCADHSSPFRNASSNEQVNQFAAEAMQSGKMMFARGEYALAIDQFRKVVRYAPSSPAGYNSLAACYDMLGRFDVSEEYYQLALSRSPQDPIVLRNIQRSLAMQGKVAAPQQQARAAAYQVAPPGYGNQYASPAMVAAPVVPPSQESGEGDDRNLLQRASSQVVELRTAAVPLPSHQGPLPRVEVVSSSKQVSVALAPPRPWSDAPQLPLNPSSDMAEKRIHSKSVTVGFKAPVSVRDPLAVRAQPRMAAGLDIKILNAAGSRGIARQVQLHLAHKGVNGTSIGDARKRLPDSWIIYPSAQSAQASAVRKQLPFAARTHVDARFERVVVLVGEDVVPRRASIKGL